VYLYLKAFHIISMVAWMAGMFYLPRLYVYHVNAAPGSELSETFKVMEHRLLRIIINPAMIATWAFGLILIFAFGADFSHAGWLHAKLALVIL
jgi:protoporphyrinogen IX oxidase